MTDADRDELAEIERTKVDAETRRKRLLARLRQRACRVNKEKK